MRRPDWPEIWGLVELAPSKGRTARWQSYRRSADRRIASGKMMSAAFCRKLLRPVGNENSPLHPAWLRRSFPSCR
jgi:hypothetical protein